jgi:acyl-CoA:acyl-CoA alkyltransferase
MRYRNVCIEALEYELPPEVLTTKAMELRLASLYSRLGFRPGWLETVTGIRERRRWAQDDTAVDAAARAAQAALDAAGISRNEVGALISCSVYKQHLEPSVACTIHAALGLKSNAFNFDVGNACLGFLSGMTVVANMIELGQIKAGIVVSGESSREVTDNTLLRLSDLKADIHTYKDNLATLTLGSAAVAMVLTHRDISAGGFRFMGGVSRSATEHADLCYGGVNGMTTNPTRLLAEGVSLAKSTWGDFQNGHFNGATARHYALHQVGKANHDGVLATLGIPQSKALRIYPELGNVGSASVAIAMKMGVERGMAGPGDRVALMGIGSGLNVSMLSVEL